MISVGESIAPEPIAASQAAFDARWARVDDVGLLLRAAQVYAPQLPDAAALEVFDRVEEGERRLAAPNLLAAEYGEGTAIYDDEVATFIGGAVLVGADHATDPVRKATNTRGGADHGTAGLAYVLAMEGLADAVVPRGRQTGNATVTPEYPYKRILESLLARRQPNGVLSLHGMRPGQVFETTEDTEVHALLGLGKYEPRPETLAVAERLIARAQDELGLRVAISDFQGTNRHLIYENDPEWQPGGPIRDKINRVKVEEDGEYRTSRLAAAGEHSTANFIMRTTAEDPALQRMPVFQMEVSRSLRLTPTDEFTRDPKKLAMGVYMGYLLSRMAVEVMAGTELV